MKLLQNATPHRRFRTSSTSVTVAHSHIMPGRVSACASVRVYQCVFASVTCRAGVVSRQTGGGSWRRPAATGRLTWV